MTDVRSAACLALLVLGMGVRATIAAPLDDAAERYRPYMIEGIGQALAGARDLRERVAAKDLAGAKKAWISARAGWERSEVFTGGFRARTRRTRSTPGRMPTAAFMPSRPSCSAPARPMSSSDADALVEHLDSLHGKTCATCRSRRRACWMAPCGLAYEVGESKADGGESRISGTSLDDMRNNVAGIDFAYRTILRPRSRTADAKLADMVDARIEQLKAIVAVSDLPHVDIRALRRASEELVVALQGASAKLGLQRPTLEAQSR